MVTERRCKTKVFGKQRSAEDDAHLGNVLPEYREDYWQRLRVELLEAIRKDGNRG